MNSRPRSNSALYRPAGSAPGPAPGHIERRDRFRPADDLGRGGQAPGRLPIPLARPPEYALRVAIEEFLREVHAVEFSAIARRASARVCPAAGQRRFHDCGGLAGFRCPTGSWRTLDQPPKAAGSGRVRAPFPGDLDPARESAQAGRPQSARRLIGHRRVRRRSPGFRPFRPGTTPAAPARDPGPGGAEQGAAAGQRSWTVVPTLSATLRGVLSGLPRGTAAPARSPFRGTRDRRGRGSCPAPFRSARRGAAARQPCRDLGGGPGIAPAPPPPPSSGTQGGSGAVYRGGGAGETGLSGSGLCSTILAWVHHRARSVSWGDGRRIWVLKTMAGTRRGAGPPQGRTWGLHGDTSAVSYRR